MVTDVVVGLDDADERVAELQPPGHRPGHRPERMSRGRWVIIHSTTYNRISVFSGHPPVFHNQRQARKTVGH